MPASGSRRLYGTTAITLFNVHDPTSIFMGAFPGLFGNKCQVRGTDSRGRSHTGANCSSSTTNSGALSAPSTSHTLSDELFRTVTWTMNSRFNRTISGTSREVGKIEQPPRCGVLTQYDSQLNGTKKYSVAARRDDANTRIANPSLGRTPIPFTREPLSIGASCKIPFSGNQNGIGCSTNTNRSANLAQFCKCLIGQRCTENSIGLP